MRERKKKNPRFQARFALVARGVGEGSSPGRRREDQNGQAWKKGATWEGGGKTPGGDMEGPIANGKPKGGGGHVRWPQGRGLPPGTRTEPGEGEKRGFLP